MAKFTVRAAPRDHYAWLLVRTGYAPTEGFRAIECVDSRGRIRGMVGLDGWTPSAVQMHIALDSPIAARALLRPAFEYPFLEAERKMVFGVLPANRVRAVELALSLGFDEVGRIPDGWSPGVDLVHLVMLKRNCRWIPQRKERTVQDGRLSPSAG